MSKAASHFRENDVKRLVRSVQNAGLKVGRVELQGGKVVLFLARRRKSKNPKRSSSDATRPAPPLLLRAQPALRCADVLCAGWAWAENKDQGSVRHFGIRDRIRDCRFG